VPGVGGLRINRLRGLRDGSLLFPVARVALAPRLDSADLIGTAEVIAIAVLAQPALLAGGFAGLLAHGLGTVTLPAFGPWIRKEEEAATAAFASGQRTAHRAPDPESASPERKRKRRNARRPSPKKEEEL
jgi:hypothetical protein